MKTTLASRRRAFALIVFLCALVCFSTGFILTRQALNRLSEMVVPDLSNKSVESARSLLRVKRLSLEIAGYQFDQRVVANRVLSQQPAAGSKLTSGQAVKVTVSRGASALEVPALAGLPLTDALQKLQSIGLNPGRISRLFDAGTEKDAVLAQFPEPDARSSRGSNVDLLVSQGPRPQWFIMPSLIGWHVDEAVAFLHEVGIEVQEIKRKVDDSRPTGTVVEQTPLAGSRVQGGNPAGLVATSQSQEQGITQLVRLEYLVPAGGMEVRVKLMLQDDTGLHEVYNAMEKPEAQLSLSRTISGERARLFIYLNGKLQEERSLP
ncbi:MAG: PASTA domain-containing protein [candidate division FCPU426 bacterium]